MKSLPDYTVVRELGKGATATVYLAVQKNLNRRVALKVLGGGLASDATFTQRFLREGRIVAKLSHPNIVPVYDVGEHDGTLYMAMEYLDGGTLEDRRTKLTIDDLSQCLGQICDALQYAHHQGFVHRDIKLENILFRGDGTAVLGDFGIARATESLTRMTMTGAILGTPAYMSPEQVAGSELDARTDVYSLGVVLFELLSGHAPYQGDSMMSVGLQHLTAAVPKLPAAAAHLQPVIERAMAKKPDGRYDGVEDLHAAVADRLQTFGHPAETELESLHSDTAPVALDIDSALSVKTTKSRAGLWLSLAAAAAIGVFALLRLQQPEPATPVAEPPPIDLEAQRREQELNALIAQGDAAEGEGRWFSESGDGAIDFYEAALALDDTNSAAQRGLERVRRSALQSAELDVVADRLSDAERRLDSIETQWPDDATAASLRGRIETRRTALRESESRAARSRQLATSLDRASRAARLGNWTSPADDSAVGHYRDALEIDAENVVALAGIDSATVHFLNQAEQAIATSAFDEAARLITVAAGIDATHGRITTTEARLASARNTADDRARAEAAARAFDERLLALRGRIDTYVSSTETDGSDNYQTLSGELAELSALDPGNVGVTTLEALLQQHEESLAEAEEEEPDGKRFNLPSF